MTIVPSDRPKLAILAGGGDLPIKLAEACQQSGRPFLVLGLEGYADEAVTRFPHAWSAIGSVGKTQKLMREAGCTAVTLAGNVSRPDFSKLKLDFKGVRLLPKVLRAAQRGDDALLSTLIEDLEHEGFSVEGTDEVCAGLLASPRVMTNAQPTERDKADIARAIGVVRALGTHDVGQGAVVCEGLVLAVEAAEGTDQMLERCAGLRAEIRGTMDARRGVLVKLTKPNQELRVDLPTIGVATVTRAASAGLAGIAIEAGRTLIIDEFDVIAMANELGLFVVGLSADETQQTGEDLEGNHV